MTNYGSSRLEVCVLGEKKYIRKLLTDSFDTVILVCSETKESIELEISDLFIDETFIFADDENEDIKIA